METIKLADGRTVSKNDYIEAKTAQLIEFGYPTLTKDEVSNQLEKLIHGESLTVIGKMMEGDIHSQSIKN